MKILNKIAAVACLAFLTTGISVHAQKRAPMTAQQRTDQLMKNVTGVTPDQESKILTAEQGFITGMQDARNSSNGDKDAMRSQMKKVHDALNDKLKEILTADQYAQYQKWEQSHQWKGKTSE